MQRVGEREKREAGERKRKRSSGRGMRREANRMGGCMSVSPSQFRFGEKILTLLQ